MAYKEDVQLLKGKLEEAKKFWDDIGDADPTSEQKQAIDKLNQETKELSEKIAESRQYQDIRDNQTKSLELLSAPGSRPDFGAANPNPGEPRNGNKSVGQQWVESKEFQGLIKTLAPSGVINENMPLSSISAVGMQYNFEAKNLITGTSLTRNTGGSGMVRPDYQGTVPLFLRPLTLRDVFTVGTTGSDLVEWTAITSFSNQAAPTAEATSVGSTGIAVGGLKPQSGLGTALVQAIVKTIPHWIPISRRAMMDAPQMRTYIDNFLQQGAEIVLEDQMITGNNVGENFLGLDNTPGITLQPFVTDALTTTRKARTTARIIGRAVPTAFLMNPYDWEAIDLLKDGQSRYYFGGPMAMGLKTLWGLPVVESEAVLQGTFYTGDLKQAVLWDRERGNIRVGEPNDFFLRNIVAILCELRAAFGVLRPSAIVRGDLLSGPNS